MIISEECLGFAAFSNCSLGLHDWLCSCCFPFQLERREVLCHESLQQEKEEESRGRSDNWSPKLGSSESSTSQHPCFKNVGYGFHVRSPALFLFSTLYLFPQVQGDVCMKGGCTKKFETGKMSVLVIRFSRLGICQAFAKLLIFWVLALLAIFFIKQRTSSILLSENNRVRSWKLPGSLGKTDTQLRFHSMFSCWPHRLSTQELWVH